MATGKQKAARGKRGVSAARRAVQPSSCTAIVVSPNARRKMPDPSQYLLRETKLALKVPEDVRRDLNVILRRPPYKRPAVEQIWRDMKFKKRFNVSRDAFYEYARRLRAVQARAACGEVVQALMGLMEMPIEQSEQLHTAGHLVLLGRLTQTLQKQQLEPEQLVRVADALSKQRVAVVRAETMRMTDQRWLRAARVALKGRRSIFDDPAELQRRVRMIYGLDMPTYDPPAKVQTSN